MPINLPELTLPDAAAWRNWLSKHHAQPTGIWITIVKPGVINPTSLTYPQALDEALCYGWIDSGGHKRPDLPGAQYFRFTPRKPKGLWSQRNVGYVERLITEGKMQPPGLAVVEAAKLDGRFDAAYAGSANAEPPADFLDALEHNPEAKAAYEGLNRGNRWMIYFRLLNLKTQAGREKRIKAFVDMLARGDTPVPQKRAVRVAREAANAEPRSKKASATPSTSSAESSRRTRSSVRLSQQKDSNRQ